MLAYLSAGTILGLAAGFAPGPLLALVVAETIQHDTKAGIRVALAPILTDLPIIIAALWLLAEISRFQHFLGVISIIGSCFILYLGVENIRTRGINLEGSNTTPQSLLKGIMVNALSPHPYLFWFTVGGPTVLKALDSGAAAPISFVGSFYFFLVGSKIGLAFLAGRSRSFLHGTGYIYIMRSLGIILFALGLLLFRDGLDLLGIL